MWGESLRRRGRSQTEKKAFESLARIAIRHEIEPSDFFKSLVSAWEKGESMCKNVKITRRRRKVGPPVLLFTIGQEVLSQFPVPEAILEERGSRSLLQYYVQNMPLNKSPIKKRSKKRGRY